MDSSLFPHQHNCLCDACYRSPSELVYRHQYPYDFGSRLGREIAAGTSYVGVAWVFEWFVKGLASGRVWSAKSTKQDEFVDRLVVLREARHEIDRLTLEAVALLRESDTSWAVIGSMLGISKQAAQQKYGK